VKITEFSFVLCTYVIQHNHETKHRNMKRNQEIAKRNIEA